MCSSRSNKGGTNCHHAHRIPEGRPAQELAELVHDTEPALSFNHSNEVDYFASPAEQSCGPNADVRGNRCWRVQKESACRRTHILSRSERRRIIWTVITALLLILAASVKSKALELTPEALTKWKEYIHAQEARLADTCRTTSFLWSDQSPDRIHRLREREILIAPVGENPKMIPHALIHHWVGAVFIPNTSLEDVLTVVRDYTRYKEFYAPYVVDSELIQQAGEQDAFSMRMLNNAATVKFAVEAEFQSSYARVDANRWYSVGYSTRIRDIETYGQANQDEFAPNDGHRLIWRLYNTSRFEQRDQGVYIELETLALSRDVPSALRWLVNPAVRRASRNSMLLWLQKTEAAVLSSKDERRAAAALRGADIKGRPVPTRVNRGLASFNALLPSTGRGVGSLVERSDARQ